MRIAGHALRISAAFVLSVLPVRGVADDAQYDTYVSSPPSFPQQHPSGYAPSQTTVWSEPPPTRLPAVTPASAYLAADSSPPGILPSGPPQASPPSPPPYVTQEQLKAELKKASWSKGEFTVVPYGTIWGSMSYETERSRIGDYTLWIESPDLQGEEDFNVDAKSTRIGFDFTGPCIPCFGDAKIGGKVEIDFQGQFVTRNKAGLLFRHAYVEARHEDYRLLVGQTWDVISPLAPPTFNYTAGSAAGNLAYRRAQFRAERFFNVSDTLMFTLQGSLNANVVTDFVSDTAIRADPGGWPDVQVRGAITLGARKGATAKPVVLGIGAHAGEQNFDFPAPNADRNLEVPTWSVAADVFIPLGEKLGFHGEFFHGENLSAYMAGILQGVDRVTHRPVHATGGWVAIWYDWQPDLHSNFGYSIDDPLNSDLTVGRTYNDYFFSNVIYDVSKNLLVGLEVSDWKTNWIGLAPGEALRFEFITKYRF